MKWFCKIRHKWGAWDDCNVEDGDNVLASVAHYRECTRCHQGEIITYFKNQYAVNRLLTEAREFIFAHNKKTGAVLPAPNKSL